jgi:demethylmenaquinone methyltransferase/2-methoxy-6-polyprenyl-1,4-benzoquinol methylase
MNEYRLFAPIYDWVLYPFMRGIRHDVLRLVEQIKPDRIIDVCCGTGDQLRLFRRTGMNALGIDYSDAMLKVAARKSRGISCLKQDAAAMAFTDHSFDAAVVSMGLHETGWEQAQAILSEIHRILKPSGKLIVVDYELTPATGSPARAGIHAIEYIAGNPHFSNFMRYLRKGGLEKLIDPRCFVTIEKRLHGQRSIVVRMLQKKDSVPITGRP